MLYGAGLTEEDMHKAQVGIASLWWEGNAITHVNLRDLRFGSRQSMQQASAGFGEEGERGV